MGQSWAAAIDTFKSTHPGVTVTHEAKAFEDIQANASMILNSNAAPDVMEYNKGNATAGLLSTQGLLTDLTSVATARGWDKILTPSLQTTCKYTAKGVMGGDKWFGVTTYGEYVMVYYNKDMFTKYNVSVPTTLADFETAMDTFVKAGITPVATGGAEYTAQQVFYQLVLAKADRQFINDYEMYANAVDFHDAALTFGATEFAKWMKNGYLTKNEVGLTAQQAGDNPRAAGGTARSSPRSLSSSGASSSSRATLSPRARAATSGSFRPAPRTRTWRKTSSTSPSRHLSRTSWVVQVVCRSLLMRRL